MARKYKNQEFLRFVNKELNKSYTRVSDARVALYHGRGGVNDEITYLLAADPDLPGNKLSEIWVRIAGAFASGDPPNMTRYSDRKQEFIENPNSTFVV